MLGFNDVSAVLTGGDRIDAILKTPISKMRLELKKHYDLKSFSAEEFDDFVKRIEKLGGLDDQVEVARKALEKKSANPLDIKMNTGPRALLWAAVTTRLMFDAEDPKEQVPVTHLPLWEQMQRCLSVYNEEIKVARVIAAAVENEKVTFAWGAPGTWFYNNPKENHLNLDFYYSMLVGFENVRAVHLHEIGHSQLTKEYPPEMREIWKTLKEKFPDFIGEEYDDDELPDLTIESQKEAAVLLARWKTWFQVFNTMEDICVDKYAIDMSNKIDQRFDKSLNYMAVMLRGYAEIYTGEFLNRDIEESIHKHKDIVKDVAKHRKKEIDKKRKIELTTKPLTDQEVKDVKAGTISPEIAQKMFNEISRATLLYSYERNNLFKDKNAEWEKFHVFKEDINRTVDTSKIPNIGNRTAFEYLCAVSASMDDSVRTNMPKPSDTFLVHKPHKNLKDSYHDIVTTTATRRTDIMQEVWDLYLKPYADVLINEFEKQVEQELKNPKPQQGNGKGKGQKGEGQGGEGQGEGQEGQGQGQEGQESGGGGTPQSSQGGGGGGSSRQQKMSKRLRDAMKDVKESPGSQSSDDKKKEKEQKAAGDKAKAEQKKNGQDKGQGAGGKKSVDDLKGKKEVETELSDKEKEDLKNQNKGDMPNMGGNGIQAGTSRGVDLSQLAKGSWNDFAKRVAELSPVINRVAEDFKKIRAEQRRFITKQAKDIYEFTAVDGDFRGRISKDRKIEKMFKERSGQMTTEDSKTFRGDRTETLESSIEIVCMIDGSGSMNGVNLGNGTTAMDTAIQSSVIVYMAAVRAGIDAFICMWGDAEPIIIATPKSNLKEVGREIERYRRGTGSGTNLAPGVIKTVESMANYKAPPNTISGSSHLFVFSDGGIFDPEESKKALKTVVNRGNNISIDVAVLKAPGDSGDEAMEEMLEDVLKSGRARRTIGLMVGHDANKIPLAMSGKIRQRVRRTKIKTEPDKNKRQKLKSLHRNLKR